MTVRLLQPLGQYPNYDLAPGPPWVMVCRHLSGTHVTLLLLGEVDVSTADQLQTELLATLADNPGSVTVDLSVLDFCGLAGLDALHALQEQARTQGVPVHFTGMSRQLRWLHRAFPRAMAPTTPGALAAPVLRSALRPVDPDPIDGAA